MKKGTRGINPENLTPVNVPSTWKAMEALYDSDKVRAIGVSNFSTKKLADLVEVARVPPAVNQVECHPSWQQHKLREFCKQKGVHLSVSVMFHLSVSLVSYLNFCALVSYCVTSVFSRDILHWVHQALAGSRVRFLRILFSSQLLRS